ncbi:hypothetical protein [Phytoactinopolyspora mesophila]|uniref:Uncharacterized protein n=1 Tax=Phytoactinopolyspora mesophila TaxID=2650750 RepID=A0A7K3M595_9ACTN|nr:hypothetical protein [Phytoactinopolyspora mesophila]NDL58474.1 hypothetical protein [Phytoactinopolyspora mesophila]
MTDTETFRALARSSPWLWTSVRFSRTTIRQGERSRVQAWIRRPGMMRAEPDDAPAVVINGADESSGGRGTSMTMPARPGFLGKILGRGRASELNQPTFRTPQDPLAPQPVWRADGLVAQRPGDLTVVYDDPMYQDYQWVAMLDPVELADGTEPDDAQSLTGGSSVDPSTLASHPAAVDVIELSETEHHGRPAIEALVLPTRAYSPRCSCCPLLFSAVSAAHMREEGAPLPPPLPVFAEAYRVKLDRHTGICVSLRDIGGDRDGEGFEVVIGEVDAEYSETLFGAGSPP